MCASASSSFYPYKMTLAEFVKIFFDWLSGFFEMTKAKSQFRKDMERDSARVLKVLQELALHSQFYFNTHNSVKLEKSLGMIGRLDLLDRTLLSPDIHKKHHESLADRFVTKWNRFTESKFTQWKRMSDRFKSQVSKPTDKDLAQTHLRLFTLIDSVTEIDHREALKSALKLKDDLRNQLSKHPSLWCLGVIETEVVSLKVMRGIELADLPTESEKRKLNVCEKLAERLSGTFYESDTSLFLIHFHGVLLAKSEIDFDDFQKSLSKVKRWSQAARQIEIKRFSRTFNGKSRSTEQNLRFISRYITKGGNDMVDGKTYLRYKSSFENSDYQSEEDWITKNWRRSQLLKKERIEEGLDDPFSLTVQEIGQLVLFVDGLMASNRTRTGYLVSSGN